MSSFLLILALGIAILDWIAVGRGWRKLEYFAKPGAMLALLVWYISNGGLSAGAWWFAAALLLSLAGDIFLVLPKEQFIAGLACFLAGHLAYAVGFTTGLPPFNLASLAVFLILLLVGLQIHRRLNAGLDASGKANLRLPVLFYSIIIGLMLFSALMTLVRQEWAVSAALFASGGAMLFFISDTLLAWNRFVAPIRHQRVLIMSTYHLGQMGLALGAALQFLS